jgi:colanic acid biosynthesis glycosyl transferase WcaI
LRKSCTRPGRVLFISQVYSPSCDAISQMLSSLAEGLAEKGWEVHVLTPRVDYMTGASLARHECVNGVYVRRTPAVPLRRDCPWARAFSYGSFLGLSAAALAFVPKPDVAVYLSTPPFVAWSAPFLKRMHQAEIVYWAQDVYPDVAVQTGYLKNKALCRALFAASRRISAAADKTAVISEGMRRVFLDRGIPADRIEVIPNWSVTRQRPVADETENPLRRSLGLLDKFVVQYSGNMGVVHDMHPICDAMVQTKDNTGIFWMMVGGGKRRVELEQTVSQNQLTRTVFLPYQPLSELGTSLNAADAALISLRPEAEGLVLPSKIYGAMAAGLPIVFTGDKNGEVARMLAAHGCGLTAANGKEFVDAILKLKSAPKLRRKMGENGRAAYARHYSKEQGVSKFHRMLTEVLSS